MTDLSARRRKPGCLSNLELDELLAGDMRGGAKEARLRDHLEDCSECSGRLSAFAAVEPPAASASLRNEARPPARRARWNRRNVVGVLGGAACAAAAALFFFTSKDPTSAERTKGGLALTIFIKGAGGAVDSVQGEGRLHPGDEMRFSLTAGVAGHAVVLGLDSAPSVTLYVPAPNGDAVALRAVPVNSAGDVLPGSIVADGTTGAERVFAVLCSTPPDPLSLRAAAVAALARVGGRPEGVSALDSGCMETSVLLHKDPRPSPETGSH